MWIVNNMRWIMLLSGALTATMVQAVFAPDASIQSNFGESVSGPAAHLVIRNWGALIAMIGGMLIYGAFNPLQRALVLTVAGASKLVFIGLVLSEGSRYLSNQAGVAVGIDAVMVVLFGWYLVAAKSTMPRDVASDSGVAV